jgi:3-methyladenine DNA glycosylase/8-oxoguanine DNA glycosylase
MAKRWSAELELKGAGGEAVDLWRTLASHGVADLPPNVIDDQARTFETTLALPRNRARTIRIRAGRPGRVLVEGEGIAASDAPAVKEAARHILRLDADLSGFYDAARDDPDLDWACIGAGRMLRSPTVFEDVVKTICTQRGTDPESRRRPSSDRKSRFYSDAGYTASGSTFREALTRPA